LVELRQVRQWHMQVTHRCRLFRQVQRYRRGAGTRGALPKSLEDGFNVVASFRLAPFDGPLHRLGRLLRQQLHDADVVLDAAARSVLLLQSGTQLGKERWQLPAAKDVRVVQRRRLAVERLQVVLRIEALLVRAIQPRMPGDHLAVGDHFDVVHVALDRHRLKGGGARRAVAVVVESHRLVLVHLGRLEDTRIEGERR
jgi:hypothetical protein